MESNNCKVVVVGSCMIDLVSFTPRLPMPGETLHGYKFIKGFGGKGSNQCVAAARLGCKAALVARLGDDNFGKEYLEHFKANGISTEFVQLTKGVSSGIATISVEANTGQNSIVIVSGANKHLCPDDIYKAESVIKQAKVVVCQLETEASASLYALQLAKKYGVQTILNAAPGQSNLPDEIFKFTDVLCLNETEVELITNMKVLNDEDARLASLALLDKDCGTVIITMGKDGAYALGKECPQGAKVPARKVTPVDTTGAGDAFVGALAHYLSEKNGIGMTEILRRCCEVATMSVMKEGTQQSFPYKKDLPSF